MTDYQDNVATRLRQSVTDSKFYRVEDYLWNAAWKHPPGSDLRNWYIDAWWTLVEARDRFRRAH